MRKALPCTIHCLLCCFAVVPHPPQLRHSCPSGCLFYIACNAQHTVGLVFFAPSGRLFHMVPFAYEQYHAHTLAHAGAAISHEPILHCASICSYFSLPLVLRPTRVSFDGVESACPNLSMLGCGISTYCVHYGKTL
eukprot:6200714-Pleurochrysis_carterae.AAC.3